MKNIKRNKPIKRILSLLTVIALLVTSVIVCPVVTSAADAPAKLESSALHFGLIRRTHSLSRMLTISQEAFQKLL